MKILVMRKTETLKYAAEELAKYLNMMDGTEANIIDFGEADIKLGLFEDLAIKIFKYDTGCYGNSNQEKCT